MIKEKKDEKVLNEQTIEENVLSSREIGRAHV